MLSNQIEKKEETISPFRIFATDLAEIREAIAANVGEHGLSTRDLESIRVPAGGGTAWTVQGLDGEEMIKELTGIIVGSRDTRSYWPVPMDISAGRTPPSCSSIDARTGIGTPGGECGKCPLAQFGSGSNGEGQACKLVRQLFIVREGNLLPEIVNLPPGSISSARQYFLRLASKGLPYYSVITRLTLEKTKNGQGIVYSRAILTAGGRLQAEAAESAKQYTRMIEPWIQSTPAITTAANGVAAANDGEVV